MPKRKHTPATIGWSIIKSTNKPKKTNRYGKKDFIVVVDLT